MKLFPEKTFFIELEEDNLLSISELKSQTLSKEKFVSNWNNQAFIGEIKNDKFEVKLSIKLFGEVCVFNGKLENKKGELVIKTSRLLKIIFVLIGLFAFSGVIPALIQNEYLVIFKFFIVLPILRFTFLELWFRIISKRGINKLIEILKITNIITN